MNAIHTIHAGHAFEVTAELRPVFDGAGTSLTVRTRWPQARGDRSEHVALQLTLSADEVRRLGLFLAGQGTRDD